MLLIRHLANEQVAGDFGGTKNGTVVHWPAGIKSKGELRRSLPRD